MILIGLHSGGVVRIDPEKKTADVSQVTPHDLAYGLAHVTRFGGQVGAYSVAEHSVRLARWVYEAGHGRRAELAMLLHDAPECLGEGDHQRFVKRAFFGSGPAEYSAMICDALWQRFAPDAPHRFADYVPLVKWFDERLGHAEARALGMPCEGEVHPFAAPHAPRAGIRYAARVVISEYMRVWEDCT